MKKTLLFIAKAFISFALIWYLLSRTDLTDVIESIRSADLFWLFMAFLLLYVGKILTGYRWQALLAAQDIRIPLWNLIASIFVGQFFNSFLPTTVGGDAIRMYDTAVQSKDSTKSVTSVFLDRLIGVFALALLAILALIIGFLLGDDVSFYVLPVVIVFILSTAGILVIFNRFLAIEFETNARKFGLKKIAKKLHEANCSFQIIKDDKKVLLIAFIVSIALQVNVVLFYYFIGLSIDIGVSLLYFFMIVPVALVVLLVPFSINGIGLREGIFVFLLTALAVPTQQSIALSLLSFGLLLTQGVLGGIIFALRGTDLINLRPKQQP